MREKGFIIYPGKTTKINSFRIGNIGEISENDINQLTKNIKIYLQTELVSIVYNEIQNKFEYYLIKITL